MFALRTNDIGAQNVLVTGLLIVSQEFGTSMFQGEKKPKPLPGSGKFMKSTEV